jgi:hypothetical protein
MIIKIQCLVRVYKARKTVQEMRRLNINAKFITRNIFRLQKRRKFIMKSLQEKKNLKFVIIIQKCWRQYMGRKKYFKIKTRLRVRNETEQFLLQRINQLLSNVQLKIILDTMKRS